MEQYRLDRDVKVFYVRATSFPEGIKDAWESLHKMIGNTKGRHFYGLSHGGENGIVYKAAVEEQSEAEGNTLSFENFIIPQGDYLAITITDYMRHIPLIGQAFRRLLAHPEFDGITPCIEWYKSDEEVVCMVKKK